MIIMDVATTHLYTLQNHRAGFIRIHAFIPKMRVE
jgi:hypothetical protein